MLILFDVDATLISTSRTGIHAMAEAGRSLFGDSFSADGVEYAGRLDPLIIADLLMMHGRDADERAMEAFRGAYRAALERNLLRPGIARALPGVLALLDRLADAPGVTLGLLTGNYPETGAMKLRASGVDPDRFAVRVWGCDSAHTPPSREHLPPVGFARYRELRGVEIDPRLVTIVGDTPHDVRCARVNGCRSLGVATGQFSAGALRDAGADHAVEDLSPTEDVASWLMSPARSRPSSV